MYAAFLGLAAVAFVADRLMFQPAGAGAAQVPVEAVRTDAHSSAGAPVGEPATTDKLAEVPSLAAKLQEAAPGEKPDRDPFLAPWQGAQPTSKGKSRDGAAVPGTPGDFAAAHELKAVYRLNDDIMVATIGKSKVQVGDVVDGWTLVAIEKNSVVLERGGGGSIVTLELKGTVKVNNQLIPRRPDNDHPALR